jgi:clan AA aspartic protease
MMGIVQAEITLRNAIDVGSCERGFVKSHEIRQATITAVVDTGAATLVINENMCRQLGLGVSGTKVVRLANNAREIVKIAGPVEIHWKNRSMTCQPWVVSENGKNFLGAIPLEDMDLMVDPKRQALAGAHGDEEIGLLPSITSA